MATVSELKEKAREYEQQGEVAQALKIYQHVLKHFEGTPSLVKVLPLYVKVGDLHLREGRTEAAVSAYQAAAKEYAIHGAAQRVDALCSKIERVDPNRADAHARLAQKLIDHGHAGSARDILAAYAEKEGLTEIQETLDDLAGRDMKEVEPLLIKLLASWGDGAAAPSEQAAARLSNQLQIVTDREAGDLAPEPEDTASPDDEPEEETEYPDDSHEPVFINDPEPEPAKQSSTMATVAPMADPVEIHGDTPVKRADPAGRGSTRPRVPVLTHDPALRGPPPPAKTGVGVPVLLGGMALALVAGFFGGRFTAPIPEPAPPPIAAQPVIRPAPAPPAAADSLAPLSTSPARPPAAPADTVADVIDPPGTTNPPPAENPRGPDVIDPPGTTNPPPAEAPGPAAVIVEGLEILGIFDIEFRGQAGYRVVQRLDASGGELTIESYPDTTGGGTGRVTVRVTPPDTVVGILRMGSHMVYASGTLPEDSLRSLMARLVVQPQN